jgi:hypothetical protein
MATLKLVEPTRIAKNNLRSYNEFNYDLYFASLTLGTNQKGIHPEGITVFYKKSKVKPQRDSPLV